MEMLHLSVVVGLCMCSMTYGLPLPRLVYQHEANPYWEVRPASEQFTVSDLSASMYTSYLQGRFDPDRPYIQMIVPNTDEMAVAEKKPIGPFGPTRPTPPVVDKIKNGNKIPACINGSLNGTNSNGTNATECHNKTLPARALLMLAEGTTIYAVEGRKEGKKYPSLDGAYELAYVAHRPHTTNSVRSQLYPLIQHVDYNQPFWDGFGGSPLLGYSTTGLYQSLYVYKPVYPSVSRNYDVYYYLPTNHEDQSNAELQEKPKGKSEDTPVLEPESRKTAQVIDVTHESMTSADKVAAKEIAMPNAVEEADPEEQALVDALNSKIKELQQQNHAPEATPPKTKERGETIEIETETEDHDELNAEGDEELDSISDKDLLDAVERVLQQLHSRLID